MSARCVCGMKKTNRERLRGASGRAVGSVSNAHGCSWQQTAPRGPTPLVDAHTETVPRAAMQDGGAKMGSSCVGVGWGVCGYIF